jgi:hypothetical protein
MDGPVGDPVFLCEGGWGVDGELLGGGVVGGGGLHFDGVVAVAELGEAEAAGNLEFVELLEDLVVWVGVQG